MTKIFVFLSFPVIWDQRQPRVSSWTLRDYLSLTVASYHLVVHRLAQLLETRFHPDLVSSESGKTVW